MAGLLDDQVKARCRHLDWELARVSEAQNTKTVVQSGPKPHRAFVGSCRIKPEPYI
jgi:hypothetical protein